MKKNKIILPTLAFTLALTGVFASRYLYASALPVPPGQYYYTIHDVCSPLPVGNCNESPFGAICTFNDGSGVYTEVYKQRVSAPPQGQVCHAVLRHSLNGGMLN
jgi:hypothetical protein